jgi:acylphosphatase
MDYPTIVRRVLIEGLVQGVGYREFTRRSALRLNISGWVRNRSDGTVEALLGGAAEDLETMLAQMREGPPGARVANLRIAEREAGDVEESTFQVRATV